MFVRICGIAVCALALVACGSDNKAGPSCGANADCGASQVCAQGSCADALSVAYEVTLAIDVASTEPDGTPWDSDGSPPDVSASLSPIQTGSSIPGAPILQWDTDESFHPSWTPQQTTFTGSQLQLDANDDDTFGSGDHICTVQLPEIVGFLHQGGGQVESGSCRVSLTITPSGN